MPLGITLSPTSLAFGSVNVGVPTTLSFTITATGFGPYSISSFANGNPDFTSSLAAVPLGTGSTSFNVTYTPSSVGSESDTFAIQIFNGADNSTTEYDLPVSGTGVSAGPAFSAKSGPVIDD
jgi:hypothetical protein